MAIYIILILFSIFLTLKNFNQKSINKREFKLLFIIAVLYIGLRYRIGTDSFAYAYLFENVVPIYNLNVDILASYRLEPLWYIYLSVLKTFCSDFIIVQFVSAIFLNAAYFKFFKQYCSHPFTAVTAYLVIDYLLINCEFMRQALAIAVFYLYAFDKLEKHQLVEYYIFSIGCCFLHSTMIIALLFPIIYRIKISIKYIIVIMLFSIIIFSRYSIFNIIDVIFPNDSVWKIKNDAYSNIEITMNLNYILQKIYMAVFALIAFFNIRNEKLKSFLSLYMLMIVLSFSHGIFSRLLYVMSPVYMVAIADSAHFYAKKFKMQIITIVFILCAFVPNYFYYMHTYSDSSVKVYSKFFPYSSYFNKFKDKDRESLGAAEQFYKNMFH